MGGHIELETGFSMSAATAAALTISERGSNISRTPTRGLRQPASLSPIKHGGSGVKEDDGGGGAKEDGGGGGGGGHCPSVQRGSPVGVGGVSPVVTRSRSLDVGRVGARASPSLTRTRTHTRARTRSQTLPTVSTEAAVSSGEVWLCVLCCVCGSITSWYSWELFSLLGEYGMLSPGIVTPAVELIGLNSPPKPTRLLGLIGRMAGACIFGHIGDRFSRRAALAAALAVVGLSSMALGLYPPGLCKLDPNWWAVLRFLQGVGVGGQWSGAVVIPMEISGASNKVGSFLASLSESGFALGMSAAAGAIWVLSVRGSGDMPTWAWRTAFAVPAAAALTIAAVLARSDVTLRWPCCGPTVSAWGPDFGVTPLVDAFRRYPVTLLAGMLVVAIDSWGLAVLLSGWGALLPTADTAHEVLKFLTLALLGLGGFIIVGGALGDRVVEEKKLYVVGAIWTGVASCTWLRFIGPATRPWPLFLSYLLTLGPAVGLLQGSLPALLIDQFHESVRYTGTGLVYHACHLIVESTFPPLTTALIERSYRSRLRYFGAGSGGQDRHNVIYLAMYMLLLATVSAYAAVKINRYHSQPLFSRGPTIRENIVTGFHRRASRARSRLSRSSPSRRANRAGRASLPVIDEGSERSSSTRADHPLPEWDGHK